MTQPTVTIESPTINQVLAGWLQNAVSHPRSTVSGFLSIGLGVIPALMICDCLGHKVGMWLISANAVCKALWSAFAMRDSGSTLALVPGSATPQMTPSHETPDIAAAIPVVPAVPDPK